MLVLNRKIIYIIFSGFWRIPITCCQISAIIVQKLIKRIKILCVISILFNQLPFIGYTVYNLYNEKYWINNYKLFYGGIDVSIINIITIVIECVFIVKQFIMPYPYKKYILEGVSNRSLAAVSIQVHQQEQDDNDLQLKRSNSTQGLKKQSQQMKQIDYKSVFDPHDFQDPDYVQPSKLQHAMKHGKFRKKNMKKKKDKRNLLNDSLDIIDEDSQQQQQENKKNNKNNKNKNKLNKGKWNQKKKKGPYMNNYMYWKPPQKVQNKYQKQFKMHKQEIMQTIRQKQSDFDTITRNDIIFQQQPMEEQSRNSSHQSQDINVQDSRRILNRQYDDFINKNYARKRHL